MKFGLNRQTFAYKILTCAVLLVLLVPFCSTRIYTQYKFKYPEERELFWTKIESYDQAIQKLSKDTIHFGALVFDHLANENDRLISINRSKWYINSRWWKKTNSVKQAEIIVLLAQNLALSDETKQAIKWFHVALEKHIKSLNKSPLAYALALIELSNCYAVFGQKTLVVELLNKAIDVCHAHPTVVNLNDFITAYNNLLYYELNSENLERFKRAKSEVLDSLAYNSREKLFYMELISKKYDVLNYTYQNRMVEALTALKTFSLMPVANREEQQKKSDYFLSAYPNVIAQLINLQNFKLAGEIIDEYINLSIEQKSNWNHFYALSLKANLLFKMNSIREALNLLENNLENFKPSPQAYSFYSLQVFRAQVKARLNLHQEAETLLDSVMILFSREFLNPQIVLQNFDAQNFSQVNNTTVLSFVSMASNVYADIFKHNHDVETLNKGASFAKAASIQFTYNYELGEFDESLAQIHKRIAETLLSLLESGNINNPEKQIEYLSQIEQNASQHLLKEFQNHWIASHPKFKSLYIKERILINSIEVSERELTLKYSVQGKRKLEVDRDSLKILREQIRLELGGFYELQKDFDFAKIQKKLNVDEQLIKFHEGERNLFRILVSRDKIEVKTIGLNDSIKPKILAYANLMRQPQSQFKTLGKELYRLLLPNKIEQNLFVIPEGYMSYLNLETLIDKKEQYLINNHNIAYCPSIPFWYATKIYPKKDGPRDLLCFTANYQNTPELNSLKYASEEVEEILKSTPGIHIESARVQDFKTQIQQYSIAHLSMHAILSDDADTPSELIFSNNEKLRFTDIYDMNLPLEMIVLSACNTGMGNLKNGEGIMSLSRALMLSGVRSNVVSLWSAPDLDTKTIMVDFYALLNEGYSKNFALAKAKRNFLKNNPLKQHPFFWGGFVLNGDNVALFDKPIRINHSILLLAGLLAGITLWIYFRRSASNNRAA